MATSLDPNLNKSEGAVNQPSDRSAIQAEQERLQQALARKMAENAAIAPTHRLAGRTLDSARPASWLPSGSRAGSAGGYVLLPAHLAQKADLATGPRWRIELHGLTGSAQPIGFDLVGDVVVGRSKEGPAAPDVDLDDFGAQKMGVSRRHVILRPTEKHLYLIDLNSTNGTMHNGLPVGPGVARSVQHNDTVMLGDLTFTLKILARPGGATSQITHEPMSFVELLNRENARKAEESTTGASPELITRRMEKDEHILSPVPKFSANPNKDGSNDTPPRPIPSASIPFSPKPQPTLATTSQPQAQPQSSAVATAKQPEQPAAPSPEEHKAEIAEAKPAKIMGLRARLLNRK